ncbi:MAG: outer membrane beta-barrel protein [Spirochaetes bacterium]|nr:outer membrane beta-barrel protein [Spirochaetota bacterium]
MKRFVIPCLLVSLVLPAAGAFAREGLYLGAGFGYNDITGGVNGDYREQVYYLHSMTGYASSKDMVPLTIAARLQYNFLPYLFVRSGFNYTFATEGRIHYLTYTATNKYNFSSWEIPLTLGLSLDVLDGRACLYLGLGASYGHAVLTETDYANGIKQQKMRFGYSGFGPHVLAGMDIFITDSLGIYLEFQMTANHGMVDHSYTSPVRIAYDVNAGGMFYRCGVVYKIQ